MFRILETFKVGIIGCGDIGFVFDYNKKIDGALTHFKAFNNSNKFEVKAIAETRKDIRDIIESEYEIKTYESYERMLEENELDVIVVATNDESHFEILNKLINHKPKLVFSEKPLTLNLEEAERIVKSYGENKIPLLVNYTRRFLEEFFDIEKIIKENGIGDIESATFYYSRGLIHNASHYLDLVLWYFGEPEKILRVSDKEGISKKDLTTSFDLFYSNGLEVRFIGLKPTRLSFAEIDLVGTNGRVKVNYKNEMEIYKVIENKTYKGYLLYEMYECKPIQFTKALLNAVENIYKVLKKEVEPMSPAINSLKIFELINRIKDKPLWQN